MRTKVTVRFIEPMLLLKTEVLPDDTTRWAYQLKVDGYRSMAFRSKEAVHLRSRNDYDFAARYPDILKGLAKLPDESVDRWRARRLRRGRKPSFNALQNYGLSETPIVYYVFDVLVLAGRDVCGESLEVRRDRLERTVLPKSGEPVRHLGNLDARLSDLIASAKAQGLEGLVAKRRDSVYEAGRPSGAWQRMRVNRGQGLVVRGYTIGAKTFDALVFGEYDGDPLIYAARTRNGFTPIVRAQLMKQSRH